MLESVVDERLGSHLVWVKLGGGLPSWPAEILQITESRAICCIAPALGA